MSKFDPSIKPCAATSERLLPSRAFLGLAAAVLDKGADFRLRAKGMSMNPFLQDGDIVTIGRLIHRPRVGDVVAAPQPETGLFVLHRIVLCTGNKALLKGDATPFPDGWVPLADIVGIVKTVQRRGRRIPPASRPLRKGIAHISRSSLFRPLRYSLYKRLVKFGEVF